MYPFFSMSWWYFSNKSSVYQWRHNNILHWSPCIDWHPETPALHSESFNGTLYIDTAGWCGLNYLAIIAVYVLPPMTSLTSVQCYRRCLGWCHCFDLLLSLWRPLLLLENHFSAPPQTSCPPGPPHPLGCATHMIHYTHTGQGWKVSILIMDGQILDGWEDLVPLVLIKSNITKSPLGFFTFWASIAQSEQTSYFSTYLLCSLIQNYVWNALVTVCPPAAVTRERRPLAADVLLHAPPPAAHANGPDIILPADTRAPLQLLLETIGTLVKVFPRRRLKMQTGMWWWDKKHLSDCERV